MTKKVDITPELKVYKFLEDYPELEPVLIAMAPEFSKLTNPFLRKTIARVTSLAQAAAVAHIPASSLVNRLRLQVGLPELEATQVEIRAYGGAKPEWCSGPVKSTHDAREAILKGQMPLADILQELQRHASGEVYLLITPVLPAPLLEKIKEQDFESYTEKLAEQHYLSWIRRA